MTCQKPEYARRLGVFESVQFFQKDHGRVQGHGTAYTDAIQAAGRNSGLSLSPRSFIFSVRSELAKLETLLSNLKTATEQHKAHVHGLVVLEKNWLVCQQGDPTGKASPQFIGGQVETAFASFCAAFWKLHPELSDAARCHEPIPEDRLISTAEPNPLLCSAMTHACP